jgi:hypothetical protein
MSTIPIVLAVFAALLAAAPADASQNCRRAEQQACTMTDCCHHHDAAGAASDDAATAQPHARADSRDIVRQTMAVWFHKPVKIGDRILLGKYLIEHDNNRMARGWPCTYIYAASDPRLPIVAFRCTHLERPLTTAPTIVVRRLHEANGMTEFLAFQFAGETAAHGVPAGR